MTNRIILVLALGLMPSSVLAQAIPYIYAPPINGAALIQDAITPQDNDEPYSVRSSRSVAQRATSTSWVFVPVSSRRAKNLARFVEKSRETDPAGAAKMAQLFASTDIIGMIDQKMQQTYGMRANSVADAYAVWWVSAWMGAKGRSDDATPGQMAMVKRQATNALAATPQFASATDAGKQEFAEALLIQAALIGDTIDTYKSDPAMLAKARASVRQNAKTMGLDLTTMKLTDKGFVPAGKTGAVEASDDVQLAANNVVPTDANDAAPPYLLIAAASGAGIGGVFLLGKVMGRRT